MKHSALALTLTLLAMGFPPTAYAQSPPQPPGCGPVQSHFKVSDGAPGSAPTAPASGKAAVYIIGFFNLEYKKGTPTIRLGMDGAWLGATRHNAFLRTEVDPGTHHYCAEWQSILKRLSNETSLLNLDAEAGKIYYLRAAVHADATGVGTPVPYIDLEPVSDDEGQFLLTRSVLAVSREDK